MASDAVRKLVAEVNKLLDGSVDSSAQLIPLSRAVAAVESESVPTALPPKPEPITLVGPNGSTLAPVYRMHDVDAWGAGMEAQHERLRLAFEGYIRDRRHRVEMSDADVKAEMDEWLAVAEDVEDVE